MRRSLTIAGIALATASLAAGCGSSSSSSSSSNRSVMACDHWNNIRGDVSAGILTDAELRSKISEVRSSATNQAVESAATTLLAGITSRDNSDIAAGARALNSACS